MPELTGAAEWAGLLPPGTLHIGTPGDAEAGRPLLSLQNVADYLRGVPAASRPALVVVHRHVDGQAWADGLGTEVRVQPETAHPLITGQRFFPTPDGEDPKPPGYVIGAVDKLIREGVLTRVEGLPAAFMLPARGGAPAHSIEFAWHDQPDHPARPAGA